MWSGWLTGNYSREPVERGSEQWKILTKILRDAKEEYAKVRGEMSFQAPELTPQETLDKIDALQDKVKDLKQQYNDCFAKGDFAGMEAAKQEAQRGQQGTC